MKLSWMLGLVVFLGILVGTWLLLRKRFDRNQAPATYGYVDRFEREGLPRIGSQTLDGKSFSIGDITSPIVIVNFWASWCGPCVEEFPSMLKLVEALKGKVTIVAISMDEDEADLRAFTKIFDVPRAGFHVLWDKEKKDKPAFGIDKLPESYILGRDRKLIKKVLGIENWATPAAIQYFEDLAK